MCVGAPADDAAVADAGSYSDRVTIGIPQPTPAARTTADRPMAWVTDRSARVHGPFGSSALSVDGLTSEPDRGAALMISNTSGRLPYGPLMTRLLEPLRRSFLVMNRWFAAPALSAGLGAVMSNPVTGYLMLLRTRGRRTGQVREAPLGYVIVDGSIYCCAGFGEKTAWLLNIEADPRVEVVLPGRTVVGTAQLVMDPVEWARAYRRLIHSLGLIGRASVGDVDRLDDATLVALHGGVPLVRIRATGVEAGPMDPGGRLWLVPTLLSVSTAVLLAGLAMARPWRRDGAGHPAR